MRLPTRWLIAGMLAGCAAAEPSPPWPTPTPIPSGALSQGPSPEASALLGPEEVRWAIGEDGVPEPAVGGGVTDPALKQFPTLLLFREGAKLKLHRGDCGKATEEAYGVPDGLRLRMDGTAYKGRSESRVVYDLTFDPATRRFRGTRNGQPLWLAVTEDIPIHRGPICDTSVVGLLYDAAGNPFLKPAKLTIRSLTPSNPFEMSAEVTDGSYRLNGVPGRILLVFTIEAPGIQTRSREVLIERGPDWPVNFGGPKVDEDPDGWRFPLEPIVAPSAVPSGLPGLQLF